jgi:hypothetical protein
MIGAYLFFDAQGNEISEIRMARSETFGENSESAKLSLVNAFVTGCAMAAIEGNEKTGALWVSVTTLQETFSNMTITRQDVIKTLTNRAGEFKYLSIAKHNIPELQ